MEAMTVRFISANKTRDGQIRARVRVDSVKQCVGRPELSMTVTLHLPIDDACTLESPLPERVYDRVLAYLDIA
jgi:hypothetical protein